jgi:hypothetical protein
MLTTYKTFARIQIDDGGDAGYLAATTGCLDTIAGIPDGGALLRAICGLSSMVTIKVTTNGNSCTRGGDETCPPLTRALRDKNAATFSKELTAAVTNAKQKGIPIEHFARQLSMGMTPVTYRSQDNVVRPGQTPATAGVAPQNIAYAQGMAIGTTIQTLKDLMSGACPVGKLQNDWLFHLPRLFRSYMTPGRGAGSTVNFNSTKTFHCVDDLAMYQRPPAVGLAHELIHALHNSQGINLALVVQNNQKLEEVVTTGMPPYNFEGISDNKMRTQWPTNLELRENYGKGKAKP